MQRKKDLKRNKTLFKKIPAHLKTIREFYMAGNFKLKLGLSLILFALIVLFLVFFPVIREETRYFKNNLFDNEEAPVRIVGEKNTSDDNKTMVPVDKDFGIVIPKIKANAPVVENVDPFNSQEYQIALTKGVAHAKNTSTPGLSGNTFIFAHSSDTFYNANRYNSVFYLLNKLELQDKFMLIKDGEVFEYKVSEKRIVDADSIDYMNDSKEPIATLMTCWPPGTTLKRLIVVGELDNVSQLQ